MELAKSFGGTDGFKFVNGVLDKLAADVRAHEVQAAAQQRAERACPPRRASPSPGRRARAPAGPDRAVAAALESTTVRKGRTAESPWRPNSI